MTKRKTIAIAGVSAAAVLAGGALTAAALPTNADAQLVAAAEAAPGSSGGDVRRSPHQADGITVEELTGDTADQVSGSEDSGT